MLSKIEIATYVILGLVAVNLFLTIYYHYKRQSEEDYAFRIYNNQNTNNYHKNQILPTLPPKPSPSPTPIAFNPPPMRPLRPGERPPPRFIKN